MALRKSPQVIANYNDEGYLLRMRLFGKVLKWMWKETNCLKEREFSYQERLLNCKYQF